MPRPADREPRASALSDHRARTHPSPAFSVAAAQSALDGFARAAVRGSTAGVTVPNRYSSPAGPWTGGPYPRALRHGPRAFSISLVNSLGISFVRMPPLLTHQFQAEPCRCSRRVASIIERIDLGFVSNPMLVRLLLITATQRRLNF